jgi:hypothetical protein
MTFSPRAIEAAVEAYAANDPHTVLLDGNAMQAALTAALAVDGVCLVPVDALSVVLDAAEMYWDEGPFDEGWRSQKLIDACEMVAKSVYAAASDREERR